MHEESIRCGALVSFASANYTATVELRGSMPVRLTGVPVNRGIPSAEMVAGRKVAVVLLAAGDAPAEAIVIAVWT